MVNPGSGGLSCGRRQILDENDNVVFWYIDDTRDQVFAFVNPDGTPINLTGKTIKGILKKDLCEGAFVYFDKTLALTDPVNGVATLSIVAGDLIDPGLFILEIYEDLGGSTKITTDQFEVTVLASAL